MSFILSRHLDVQDAAEQLYEVEVRRYPYLRINPTTKLTKSSLLVCMFCCMFSYVYEVNLCLYVYLFVVHNFVKCTLQNSYFRVCDT